MPLVQSEFRPAWWLRQPHLQTLWGGLRKGPQVAVRKERLELPDGDFIDLAWADGDKPQAPVVMLLHGLEGSLRSAYVRGLMHELNALGLRACLMHFRGCSGEPNRLPIAYHSGKTDDPARVLEHLQQQAEVIGAVGVSLGGNVLLKWLGEQGDAIPLQRAAAMSIPFRLNDAALRLRGGLSRIYERYLIVSLQRSYREKFAAMPCPLQVDVGKLDTFHKFDDAITAPLHGFAGVEDYYARASSRQYLPSIRIPTLIVHAQDDPFMFPHTAPTAEELPPQVRFESCSHGGHVGFVAGRWPWRAEYWAEKRIARWMAGD